MLQTRTNPVALRHPPVPTPPPDDQQRRARRDRAIAEMIRVAQIEHGTIHLSVWKDVAWVRVDRGYNVDTPMRTPLRDEVVSQTPAVQHCGRVLAAPDAYDREHAVFQITVKDGKFVYLKLLWGVTEPPPDGNPRQFT